ncbi:ribonuclease domain-containing protein [Streptomyces sp.]|uniref:ribonuclease domain-containing protein n=1 Tax=Streptomyces sp. TaxID=1931 RepID=UPI002D6E12B2|nr:ribonuclease domain-containing protein [Streptomyces sp.]HZF91302.1 ribonuclease domain-containing protein [Streptomyces sp.]
MLPRFVPRVLLCLLALLVGCSGTDTSAPASAPPWADGMVTVRAADLPAEARDTLALIDRGGPFPYDRDGAVFGNVERLLPAHERGYYREYTVRTPGSPDRGARRLVTGRGGEIYYTDDHYDSFRAVLR